jgi:rare lipoprotein A
MNMFTALFVTIASTFFPQHTASGHWATFGAAHRTLPLGTRVQVMNLHTHRSVVVRIIDRGPYVRGRGLDLTPGAARAIGSNGLAHVRVAVLDDPIATGHRRHHGSRV